jgi:hypothetical protein
MPYVPPVNRVAVDVILEGLVARLREIKARPGDCNYVVTRVVLESLKPSEGWSYHSLSDAVRVLKDAAAEIERRLLGPYEDDAILKNGDMQCFQEPFAKHPMASENIMENGQYRTRSRPVDIAREGTEGAAEKLTEGLTAAALDRKARGWKSPWELKLEADREAKPQFDHNDYQGVHDPDMDMDSGMGNHPRKPSDVVPDLISEAKKETFERLCKERSQRLKKLNDGLQRIIDGDTPPPAAEAACDEPCGGCDETE